MTPLGGLQASRSTAISIAPSSSSDVQSHPSASAPRSSTDMSVYHTRPRPGRRRSQLSDRGPPSNLHTWTWLSMALLFMSLCSLTSAVVAESSNGQRSLSRHLARNGEIVIDRLAASQPRADLARRQDTGSPFDSSSPSSSSKASASTSATPSKSATASTESSRTTILTPSSRIGTPTSGTVAPTSDFNSPLPSPFDTSIGSNFTTTSCPDFFNSFLNNATFKSCLPLSLLLQNSQSFFKASRSPILLTQTLEATCSVNLPTCSATMSSLASTLITDSACGQDYRNENPIVIQARNGLIAYEPLYRAGCLKNQGSGNYCFADAITDQSNPSDSYPYYIPLGISLPAASRPTCDQCLETTMSIFASAAVNRSQPLAQTFVPAAQQIDLGCGPTFVNTTVPVATVGGASTLSFSKLAILASILGPTIWILLA